MKERINIAIDGPAGAGKSTVAKAIAARMGIRYLDTGAMYRAMALFAARRGVDVSNERCVASILDEAEISVKYTEAGQRVLLFGEDVSDLLRTQALSMGASTVSAHKCVRVKMTELQRAVAREYDVVMDGREIGTNVLPNTKYKFYVTASAEERAHRRFNELRARGDETHSYEQVLDEMRLRDHNDSTRAYMPLRQAEDAVLIDTTKLSVEQAVDLVLSVIREKEAN